MDEQTTTTNVEPDVQKLQREITRLNKVVMALMNRAERSMSTQGSDFSLFQTAILLDDQVRSRTAELEAALRDNEKITRALRNASARMQMEMQERKRMEVLREGQKEVLEMIALDVPLEDILIRLLQCIEAHEQGVLCSVLLLDAKTEQVCKVMAPSLPQSYLDDLVGLPIGPRSCPCGTAMYRREPVFVSDIQNDPLWVDSRARAATYNVRACWSMPILSGARKVLGAFAMHYREVRHPAPADVQLIELAVRIAGIAIERKQNEEYIRHMAHHDALTGLPNRMLLEDRIQQAISQARREGTSMAVLFIDLNHFKPINDTLGHHVGDGLLRVVADRLRSCLREGDSVARLGGDEFVVCLPGLASRDDAARVAQKIQESLAQPMQVEAHRLHTSGSIGISFYPLDGDCAATLIQVADAAMYIAKGKGDGASQHVASRADDRA